MRTRILYAVAGILAAFTIACGANPGDSEPTNTGKQLSPPSATPEEKPSPAYTPVPADFALKLTTLSKQCFGSAGCNVTVRLTTFGYSGVPLGDDQAFTIVYQILGGEDGPVTNTFTLRGANVEYQPEESLSTKSSKAVLTAKVTEVLPA